jgi:hypothetical protein
MRFLREHKIHGLHYPDDHVTTSKFILGHATVRDTVETLLLGDHTPAVVARTVNRKQKQRMLLAKDVDLFRHYFWNTLLLNKDEWAMTLHGRHSTAGRKAALLGGPDVAMYKVGVRKQMESRDIMSRVQAGLFNTWCEVEGLPTDRVKVEMQVGLSRSMCLVDERMSQTDVALQEVIEKFERFTMESDKPDVISIDELGGEYNEPGRQLTAGERGAA